MAISVTINGTTYSLPTQSTNPPWGEDLSSIIEALVEVANDSFGPADILTTNFNIANNQGSVANVSGLSFSTSEVRSAIISYSVYRSTNSAESSECGQIYITYKSTAGTWELAQNYAGSSGVTFTITNAGQVQYTSTNMAGTGYSGKLKFNARAFLQA
jgi:hypothetical protein